MSRPRLGGGSARIARDPRTGGRKGVALWRFDLLPPEPLWELAAVYGRGAKKYGDRNWERGYPWSWSLAALLRHLYRWMAGQARDLDGGHHLAKVAFHAFALLTFELRACGTDDIRRHARRGTAWGRRRRSKTTGSGSGARSRA